MTNPQLPGQQHRRGPLSAGLSLALVLIAIGTAAHGQTDSVVVVGGRYPAGAALVNIPIRLVNSVEMMEISIPLEIREINPGSYINSLNITFSERLGDPFILPDNIHTDHFDSPNGLTCIYGTPTFTDGATHPVTASPEGVWIYRSGDVLSEFLAPGSDPAQFGSIYLGVDLTSTPGAFEIDTVCVDPGALINHLMFVDGDAGFRLVGFKKGIIRINSPPIARDTTISVVADEIYNGVLPVFDPDGDTLSFQLATPPSLGDVDLGVDGSFTYAAPVTDGMTSLEYQVDDGLATDVGIITIQIVPSPPDSIYVRKTGSDITGDGSTQNPFRTIPHAILQSTHGDVIFVGPGIYDQPEEVPIIFPSTHKLTITSEQGPFQTELVGIPSASGSLVVMHAPDPADTLTIVGFTVRDNTVDQPGCDFCGGGITVGNLTMARIQNCIIRDNAATGSGGQSAGGILFNGSGGRIANNWILLNEGFDELDAVGAVIVGPGANVSIVNNTISLNGGPGPDGTSGVYVADETSIARIDNNIVSANAPGIGLVSGVGLPGSESTVNNLYFGNGGDPVGFPSTATWILSSPLFADIESGDLHLTCGSPARDAGQVASVPSGLVFDIDGQLRVPANPPPRVDIGADQFYDAEKEAVFLPSVDSGCAPLTVNFTNLSTCIDESWFWTFGDGAASTAKNPAHQYLNPGVYPVRLIASGLLDADTTYDTIRVQGSLTPNFAASVVEGCVPFEVQFSASAAGAVSFYTWDFGDGEVDTGQVVSHTYVTPATRTVSVTAHNLCGEFTHAKTDYIAARTTPTVQMSSSFDTVAGAPCVPLAVQFSYSSDFPIQTWNWDFGDDHTSTDSTPVHVYTEGDTFSVRLIAIGDCGQSQVVKNAYIKLRPRPIATPSAVPTFACANVTQVSFSASITGSFSGAFWVFGDGSIQSGTNVSHLYTQVGRYLPRIVVISGCGQDTIPLPDSLTVGSIPVAQVAVDSDSGYESHTVHFTDQSANLPTAWLWRFGNGQTSTQRDPSQAYAPGVYQASLIASNACGTDTSANRRIVVGSYKPVIVDSLGVSGDTILYSVQVDSQVIGYDHTVYVTGRITPLPVQGSMNFIIEPSSGVPPFSATMKVVPSPNLVSGDYQLELRAVDSTRQNAQGLPLTKITTRPYTHVGVTTMEISPSPLSMDSVIVSLLSSRTLTIRNTTSAANPYTLIVQPALISGPPFEILPNQGNGATLGPGQSLTWILGFRPNRKGDFSGWIQVRSNDPANPDRQIALSGRGIGEQVPPQVSASLPEQGAELIIDGSVNLYFSEPMVVVPIDTLLRVRSKRANTEIAGVAQFLPLSLSFTPNEWLWPDDTVTVTLRAAVTDTNGNRLDGNRDSVETGPPQDDYVLTLLTGPGVYPGDANHDGRVSEADILPLGRFWKLQGPPRAHPYADFSMQPARGFPIRVAAHADCDGNGIIDSADICPIAEFFDQDTALAKTVIRQMFSEAQSWSSSVLDAMLGALLECPNLTSSNAILRETLMAMRNHDAVPREYALDQNYPNPFNPSTVIAFALVRPGEVELDVYDILGRRVISLAHGPLEAGRHRVVWDGRDSDGNPVASGIYFYRLQTAGFQQTRKMLLLK